MAGAPAKKGLDYFTLDIDMDRDQKVELIEAEFGLKGFGLLIKIFLNIYADEGYFMRWNSDTKLLLAKRVGESGSFVGEVVKGSIKRGLFNESVFDQFGVLTSASIQNRYFNAVKRRGKVVCISEYLLIDINEYITANNVCINSINARNNKQSRAEQSRVENNTPSHTGAQARVQDDDGPQHKPESLDAVVEFFANNHASQEMAETFYDYYASQGWVKPNGMAITSWHHAASKWIRDEKHNKPEWKQRSKSKGGKNGAYSNQSKGDKHVEALQRL